MILFWGESPSTSLDCLIKDAFEFHLNFTSVLFLFFNVASLEITSIIKLLEYLFNVLHFIVLFCMVCLVPNTTEIDFLYCVFGLKTQQALFSLRLQSNKRTAHVFFNSYEE